MQVFRKFIQWLLVGFTVVLLVPFLIVQQYLTALFLIAAIAIIIPFTKPFLETKLPFLKPAGLRLGLWAILLVMSVISLKPTGSEISTSNKPVEPNVSISNLIVCTQVQQNQCANNTPALVRNTSNLYFSADSQTISDGAIVNVALKYTPEPNKQQDWGTKPLKANRQGNKLLLTMNASDLPVGTYEATLKLQTGEYELGKKEFIVWNSKKDLETRFGDALPIANVALSNLIMCSNAGFINEGKDMVGDGFKIRDDLPMNNPFRPICSTNSNLFKSDAKTFNFVIDIDSDIEPTKLKIIWNYLKNQENPITVNEEIKTLSSKKVKGLNYTLNIRLTDGPPPGKYELIIAPETKNAKPLYRKFTVK